MNSKLLLTFAAGLSIAGSLSAQILAGWDFTGENQLATSNADSSNTVFSSTPTLTRGAGAVASAGNNSFRTTGFQNDGIALTNTDYFQFTLTATAGGTFSLSSIANTFNGTATYAAAPGGVTMAYAYSVNGGAFTLLPTFNVSGTPPLTPAPVDLTGITALQNLTTSVTFRFFASGQTATGGWGYFSSAAGVNGLAINGTSNGTPITIPEPSAVALGVIGLAGMMALRRRRN